MGMSVSEIATKWKNGVAASGAKWNNGIQQYAGNPMEMAAAQADRAVVNYTQAKDRMVANLRATPTSHWKSQSALSQSNYVQGGTKGLTGYTKSVQVMSSGVWPGMKAASQSAGGGPAGAAAAIQYAMDAKAQGRTK